MGRGTSKAGAGGLVFKPSSTDDVAERIMSADSFKLSTGTVTLKDENGKTAGMIRGFSRFSDMPLRDQSALNSKLRSMGMDNSERSMIGMQNVFTKDGKVYIFSNQKTARLFEGMKGADAAEVEKIKKTNDVLRRLENNGAIIITR